MAGRPLKGVYPTFSPVQNHGQDTKHGLETWWSHTRTSAPASQLWDALIRDSAPVTNQLQAAGSYFLPVAPHLGVAPVDCITKTFTTASLNGLAIDAWFPGCQMIFCSLWNKPSMATQFPLVCVLLHIGFPSFSQSRHQDCTLNSWPQCNIWLTYSWCRMLDQRSAQRLNFHAALSIWVHWHLDTWFISQGLHTESQWELHVRVLRYTPLWVSWILF